MYWDWESDWASPSLSPVWDPVLGFGGNGTLETTNDPSTPNPNSPSKLRVLNGPFRSLRPTYWNDATVDPHWLSRDFAPGYPEHGQAEMIGNAYSPVVMDEVREWGSYLRFWERAGVFAAWGRACGYWRGEGGYGA